LLGLLPNYSFDFNGFPGTPQLLWAEDETLMLAKIPEKFGFGCQRKKDFPETCNILCKFL